MEWERLECHVENIRNKGQNALGILVNVGTMHVNPMLDRIAYNRGFTNKKWEELLQPFIEKVLMDPSYNPDGDTKKFLYRLAYPIMRDSVIHFYRHGKYPIKGVVEYAAYKKLNSKSIGWYYYTF